MEMLAIFMFLCAGNEDVISIHESGIETTNHLVPELPECLSCTSHAKGIHIGQMVL